MNGGLDSLFGKLYAILNCSLVCLLWSTYFGDLIKMGPQSFEFSVENSMYLQACMRVIEKPGSIHQVIDSVFI